MAQLSGGVRTLRRPFIVRGCGRLFSQKRTVSKDVHVCVVGSGPAGFYTTQHLLNHGPANLHISMLEKLPVPFGLVRFGVAPDHPEVKNVDNTFSKVAQSERFRFLGNVALGTDVRLAELRNLYHAVILAYGAAKDRTLGIPGEELGNVLSARSFVGFYNGLPEEQSLEINLDHETAVVVGLGNVALDVARILLTPVDVLRKTDITEAALELLVKSRIRRVYIVGRRGPLQVAFTIKELREMVNLPRCRPFFDPDDFVGVKEAVPKLKRPRKRLTELLVKTALDPPTKKQEELWKSPDRSWQLKLLRTPQAFFSDPSGQHVAGVELGINKLGVSGSGGISEDQPVVATGETETIPCGLVLRSIGYQSVQVDDDLPFDPKRGIVPNVDGKVNNEEALFCTGWLATGPRGVIVDTMTDAFKVSANILQDLKHRKDRLEEKAGINGLQQILAQRSCRTMTFQNWERLDDVEKSRGKNVGKPRQKITNVDEMIKYVKQ